MMAGSNESVTLSGSAADSVIKNFINTGGRLLGLALRNNGIFVADAYRGLLKITGDKIEVLTEKAEGVKFRLTDSVEIAENGMIYFTDASYEYDLSESKKGILEGKPHGRFMSLI